jgi:excisionase family DNA binding protein
MTTTPVPLAHTYKTAARELQLSERSVWQLVRDGQLRAVRIGTAVRIPHSELLRFLEAQNERPAGQGEPFETGRPVCDEGRVDE